ncbi:MAG: response regulator [Bryobacteraceae bacterium]|jgi:two-component system, chemotaxis family, chemotaxis protein CheY
MEDAEAMIDLDDELAQDCLGEYRGRVAAIEEDLLAIVKCAPGIDTHPLTDRVFRAVHAVRGAGLLGLKTIHDLAQRMEEVLEPIRARRLVPTPVRVRVLLRAAARLKSLIEHAPMSNQADIAEIMTALAPLCVLAPAAHEDLNGGRMRVLLVEDDFASRLILQSFLSRHGECHLALNGREAVEACRLALEQGQMYHLICMDIMMPEMDGREAVRQVRALEEAQGIVSIARTKIIMTTAVDDLKQVIRCFEEFCDAYLMKPINLANLLRQMKRYRLIQ